MPGPPMGEGEATWPATSVSLISGEREAVLIDALLTPEDAGRVVDWIRATGKNLTTIYITHGHADHFFGLNTILDAFPDARAVTVRAGHARRVGADRSRHPRCTADGDHALRIPDPSKLSRLAAITHGFLDQYPTLFADHVNAFRNGG